MIPNTNNNLSKKYAILTNFESTYVVYLEDFGQPLLISKKLGKDEMMRAFFFVLCRNLSDLFQDFNEKSPIQVRSFQPSGGQVTSKPFSRQDQKSSSNTTAISKNETNNSRPQKSSSKQNANIGEVLAKKLLNESEFIGEGRTCCVYKIKYEGEFLALKMVDYTNPPYLALEEFENEVNVLKFFLEKKGISLVLVSCTLRLV